MIDHIHTRAVPEAGRQFNYCPICKMVPFEDLQDVRGIRAPTFLERVIAIVARRSMARS